MIGLKSLYIFIYVYICVYMCIYVYIKHLRLSSLLFLFLLSTVFISCFHSCFISISTLHGASGTKTFSDSESDSDSDSDVTAGVYSSRWSGSAPSSDLQNFSLLIRLINFLTGEEVYETDTRWSIRLQ